MKQYPKIRQAVAVPAYILEQPTDTPIILITKWQQHRKAATLALVVAMDITAHIVVKVALVALAMALGVLFGLIMCLVTKKRGFKSSMVITYLFSDVIASRMTGRVGYLETYYNRYLSREKVQK